MANIKELTDRFTGLSARAETNHTRIIRADEKFDGYKKRVAEVVAQLKEEGYEDPKEIAAILESKAGEFEEHLNTLETTLDAQEQILNVMEA